MITPSIISKIAIISCKPSTKNVAEPAENACTREMVLSTNAVPVTQSMIISGGKSILLLRPVTFKNTQSVTNTKADKSWFAEPNNGQILAYPILVRMNPHTNVTIVEKYVLHNNFLHPSACSIAPPAVPG